MRTTRRALALAAAAGLALTATPLWSQTAMTMKQDLTNRSAAIHWPTGFAPEQADLFAHNEIHVDASCERVWSHIVDASNWPAWYPNSRDVRLLDGDPVLKANSVFRWTTFGLPLESRVHEFTPHERLGWYGYAPGTEPNFYHAWYLKPAGGGCLVVTDEVGIGAAARQFRQADEGAMHRGHDLWLAALKWKAEQR